jgi:hypothetical protein
MAITVGDRVRVLYTNYMHSSDVLVKGDEGVITDITQLPKQLGGKKQFWVKWDRTRSNTALIEGEDVFEVISKSVSNQNPVNPYP